MRTFYDMLGVTRSASADDIELSYRHSLNEHIAGKRRRPLHRKDQLRLQQIRQAYLILSSPGRRLEYDLTLDQTEHAHLRRIERAGTVFGLLLLLAGLALVAHGYLRLEQTPPVAAARTAQHGGTVLASESAFATGAAGERQSAHK